MIRHNRDTLIGNWSWSMSSSSVMSGCSAMRWRTASSCSGVIFGFLPLFRTRGA